MSTTQIERATSLPSGYQSADPSPTNASQGKHDRRSPIRDPAPVQGNRGFRRKVMVRETISGKKEKFTVGSTIFQVLFTPEEVLRMAIFFAMDEARYVVRDVKSWRAQRRAAAAAQAEEQEQKTGAPSAKATDIDASTTISETIMSEEAPPAPQEFLSEQAPLSLREFLSEQRKLMAQDVRAWYDVWKQGKEVGRKRYAWLDKHVFNRPVTGPPRPRNIPPTRLDDHSIALLEAAIQRRLEGISCPRCRCGSVSPAAAQNTTSEQDGGKHALT